MAESRPPSAPNYQPNDSHHSHPPTVPSSAHYHAHNQYNTIALRQQPQQERPPSLNIIHVDPSRARSRSGAQHLKINTSQRPPPHPMPQPMHSLPSAPPPAPQTPQSPFTPYFSSAAQEKHVRDSIIEVLSSTANGCIRELGYPNLYERHVGLEQAYAKLATDNQKLQAGYNHMHADNVRSAQLLLDQREENRRRAERENQLTARIKQLEQELDIINRQYHVSQKMQSMDASDAYKILEAKYQFSLEMLKKHHIPLLARDMSEAARASIQRNPVVNGARVPEVIDLTNESGQNAPPNIPPNNNPQPQPMQGSSTRPPSLPTQSQATPSTSSTVIETIHNPNPPPANHFANAGPSTLTGTANTQAQSNDFVPVTNVALLARSVKRALAAPPGTSGRKEKRRKESVHFALPASPSTTHPPTVQRAAKQVPSPHPAASTPPSNQPQPSLPHQQKANPPQETQSLPGTPVLAASAPAPPSNQPHPSLHHQQKANPPQETQSPHGTPVLATPSPTPIVTNQRNASVTTQANKEIRALSAPPIPAPVLYTSPSQDAPSSSRPGTHAMPGAAEVAPVQLNAHIKATQTLWDSFKNKHSAPQPLAQPQTLARVRDDVVHTPRQSASQSPTPIPAPAVEQSSVTKPTKQSLPAPLRKSASPTTPVQLNVQPTPTQTVCDSFNEATKLMRDEDHPPQQPKSQSPAPIPTTATTQSSATNPPMQPPPAPQRRVSQPYSTTPNVDMSTDLNPKPASPPPKAVAPSMGKRSEEAKDAQSGPSGSSPPAPLPEISSHVASSVQSVQEPAKELAESDVLLESTSHSGMEISSTSEALATEEDADMDVDDSANPPPVIIETSVKDIVMTEDEPSSAKDVPENDVPDAIEAANEDQEEDEEEEEEEVWDDLTDDEDGAKRSVPDCVSTIFYDDENDERLCHFCNARLEKLSLPDSRPTFSDSSMRDLISHSKEEHPITWKKLRTENLDP